MTAGLTFPFVTSLDPDRAGEGSLDPLGLARLADRLADQIAPEVTARMSRIRFVTAIAACSQLLGEPADILSTDGIPAYLAPSLSMSGETLTIEESMTLRARTETVGHAGDNEHEWSWGSG